MRQPVLPLFFSQENYTLLHAKFQGHFGVAQGHFSVVQGHFSVVLGHFGVVKKNCKFFMNKAISCKPA